MVTTGVSFGLIADELRLVEDALTDTARAEHPLLGPMLSTVLPGSGKRLRPALALLTGQLGVAEASALTHMATGVELLHAASLVHDDVVDESELRRGSKTLFTRVGNALAVLVGDYLFAQSASRCVATGNVRVIGLFAQTLSSMCEGQIREASRGGSPHLTLTREEYLETIWGKTASLFVLACEGAAILAGLSEHQISQMSRFGDRLGLAFQIVDDVLDFVGDEGTLGKPVGGDLRQGTITLPVLCLREMLPDREFRAAFADQDVDRQIELVRKSGAIERAFGEAEALLDEARSCLTALPLGDARDVLTQITRYVSERRV
ncbi:MAG: polyprenyl synthetase family protein [Chloroflexota bacterium]